MKRKCDSCIHSHVCEDHNHDVWNTFDNCHNYDAERPNGECKTCKHFVKDGFGGLKNVCEHPEIQLDDYYDYACIMMEENDFCSRYEPREEEGDEK